jgi:hypothetical protein
MRRSSLGDEEAAVLVGDNGADVRNSASARDSTSG